MPFEEIRAGRSSRTPKQGCRISVFSIRGIPYAKLVIDATVEAHLGAADSARVDLLVGSGADEGKLLIRPGQRYKLTRAGRLLGLQFPTRGVPCLNARTAPATECEVELNGRNEIYITIPNELRK